MKIRSFIFTVLMSLTLLFVGCSDKNEQDIILKKASATVEVTSFNQSSAEVNITPSDAVKCAYIYKLESEGLPSAEAILSIGTSLAPTGKQTITLESLESETKYLVGIAVVGEDKDAVLITRSFTTLKVEPKPEPEPTLNFIDGFMFYDGFSETSGKYTMTIVLSTKPISSSSDKYCDLLIFVSMGEPLTSAGNSTYRVPYGEYTPFYPEESLHTNLMYDIGRHRVDDEGKPNFSGSTWVLYDKVAGTDDIFVADDTANTKVTITDNGDGTYTIHGALVDKTRNETMVFSYKDTKNVLGGFS